MKTVLVHCGDGGDYFFFEIIGVFDDSKSAVIVAQEFMLNEDFEESTSNLQLWKGKLGVLWDYKIKTEDFYHVINLSVKYLRRNIKYNQGF